MSLGLLVVSLAALLFWIGLSLDRRRSWPSDLYLPKGGAEGETASGARLPLPAISVIVPARDEADVLARTLPTLAAQAEPGMEVVLVDDQSSDGTGDLARRLEGCQSVRVVRVVEHRRGWAGKVNALQTGVEDVLSRRRDTEWLLFSDADIAHRPGSVRDLLALAEREDRDLVSIMARLHAESFWERLLIAPFVTFFQLLYPFALVRRDDSPVAAAAGGCVLVRRRALERAGGLESLRDAVIDDVTLARVVKQAGGRLWLGFDTGIVSLRPYRTLGEIWRMVARSAFVQLRCRWDLVLLVLVGILLLVVSPPVVAVWAAVGLPRSGLTGGLVLAAALVAWGLEARVLLPSVRHHRIPARYAATLPLSGGLYGLMTLSSALDHLRGRGARWKGRAAVRQ